MQKRDETPQCLIGILSILKAGRGLLDMAEFLMSCKLRMKRLLDSVFVEFYRDGKLVFSLSIEQYLRLRRLIKFIPELEV